MFETVALDSVPAVSYKIPVSADGPCVVPRFPVNPEKGADVAAIVPDPLVARDAPLPISAAMAVFVPLVSAENAVAPVAEAVRVIPLVAGVIVILVPASIGTFPS